MIQQLLISAVFLVLIVRSLLQLKEMTISEKFLKTKLPIRKPKKYLHIIIPVYQEEKIIQETVDYFESFVNKRISLTFVTTRKEGAPNVNKTHKAIIRFKRKGSLLHYTGEGDKASQLNFAIDRVKRKNKTLYFAFFDADSRPDGRAFNCLLADNESPFAYQMFADYSNGYESLSSYAKANAIFQSRWSLCFELPRTLRTYMLRNSTRLMYFVGHGLFVRSDIFARHKFSPNALAEDLRFGYYFSFRNKQWKPLPFLDCCTVPSNFIDSVHQSARWFAGELGLYAEQGGSLVRRIRLVVLRYSELAAWAFGPFVVGLSLLVTAWYQWWYLFAIGMIGLGSYVVALHYKAARIINVHITKTVYLCLLIKSVANVLGPLYAFYRISLDRAGIRKYGFMKTGR